MLLVEVSDSTLRYDLDVKALLYARHGIPELWIVDLRHDELHAFRAPQGGKYLEHRSIREPGRMTVTGLSRVEIDLSTLFVV